MSLQATERIERRRHQHGYVVSAAHSLWYGDFLTEHKRGSQGADNVVQVKRGGTNTIGLVGAILKRKPTGLSVGKLKSMTTNSSFQHVDVCRYPLLR
jgi:hypothetical protein